MKRCPASVPEARWLSPWEHHWYGRCARCGQVMPLRLGPPATIAAHPTREATLDLEEV